jgi:hypothetical protein
MGPFVWLIPAAIQPPPGRDAAELSSETDAGTVGVVQDPRAPSCLASRSLTHSLTHRGSIGGARIRRTLGPRSQGGPDSENG